ncbi:hypothetical protein B0A48_07883 [Cryoendolithus antarcticus]|uniref:Uncharacterized protein n=1 Tax=Cryoendolithus antarcticus TaxID=1507870 RepID=A0A1V8T0D3_9PEZI|nr:hypothetical protein B0A48_07883 [Cryoendolithus antarcticus]
MTGRGAKSTIANVRTCVFYSAKLKFGSEKIHASDWRCVRSQGGCGSLGAFADALKSDRELFQELEEEWADWESNEDWPESKRIHGSCYSTWTTTSQPAASARVFDIKELAEAVLLRVPNMRELFVLQRINRTVRDTIRGSISLQRRMYVGANPTAMHAGSCKRFHRNPLLFGKLSLKTSERPALFSIFHFLRTYQNIGARRGGSTLCVEFQRTRPYEYGFDDKELLIRFLYGPRCETRDSWATTRVAAADLPVNVMLRRKCSRGHWIKVKIECVDGATRLGELADKLEAMLKSSNKCDRYADHYCSLRKLKKRPKSSKVG